MGRDIHIFAEKLVEGRWTCLDRKLVGNIHTLGFTDTIDERDCGEIYNDRNYDVFKVLGGIEWQDSNFFSITGHNGRGIPNDLSPEVETIYQKWKNEATGFSWFFVKELIEYDWNGLFIARPALEQNVQSFVKNVIPRFRELGDPELIRLVFWYDA